MKTSKIQGVRAQIQTTRIPAPDDDQRELNRKQRRAMASKRKGSRRRSIADIANIRLKGGEGKF